MNLSSNLTLITNYGKHPCYPPHGWTSLEQIVETNLESNLVFGFIIAKTLIVDVEAISTMLVLYLFCRN